MQFFKEKQAPTLISPGFVENQLSEMENEKKDFRTPEQIEDAIAESQGEEAVEALAYEREKIGLLSDEKFPGIETKYAEMIEEIKSGKAETQSFLAWETVDDILPSSERIANLSEQAHERLDLWLRFADELRATREEVEAKARNSANFAEAKRRANTSAAQIQKMTSEEHRLLDELSMS